jgi:sarcosine oxidase subunit delta
MTFLLSCPHCGLRDVNEFRYQGEVTRRPKGESGRPSMRELTDYIYFRDNVAGVQREWWYHRVGCGTWFVAERDTRTNEVLNTEIPPTQRDRDAPAPAEVAIPEPPAV